MAFATKEQERAYARAYYQEHKDVARARMKKWREKNGEHHRAKAREYHHANREKLLEAKRTHRREQPQVYADRLRLKKYRLTAEEYDRMVSAQNGCCAVCGERRALVVDHNHKTHAVRALLCNPCNTAIGLFKESPKRMRAAIKYLAKSGALEQPQGPMQ